MALEIACIHFFLDRDKDPYSRTKLLSSQWPEVYYLGIMTVYACPVEGQLVQIFNLWL